MRTSRVIRSLSCSATLLSAVLLTCGPARATFPGENGRIIFTANPTGTSQLYAINPDGTDMVQITNLPPTTGEGLQPIFSPDGQRILFTYAPGSAAPNLYVINADGTGLTQLTDDGLSTAGRWSPDGTRIVFARTSTLTGANVVTTMQADGTGEKTALTSILWDSYAPVYTPDGRHIVNYSEQGGLLEAVWIMDADGSNKKRLTPAPPELFPGDVSPDGKHISNVEPQQHESPNLHFRDEHRRDGRHAAHERGRPPRPRSELLSRRNQDRIRKRPAKFECQPGPLHHEC